MVEGAKSRLESNPITTREAQRAQTKSCTHQESPKGWSQTCLWVFEHLLWRYRSAMACCRGRDSRCSRPGCYISPLGGGHHQTHHRATRIYTGLGNRLLEGTNKTLCAPGTRRKEQWSHKRLTPDLPMKVKEFPAEVCVTLACCRVGATECGSVCMDLLKEVAIIFITSIIVWSQGKEQGGNTALPINSKLD